jgi:ribosomal protein L40E
MAEVDAFSTALFLFGTLILSFAVLIVALSVARSRAAKAERTEVGEEPAMDRAYNTLVTSEAIRDDLRQKGFESARASELLAEARQAYYEGRHRDAEDLSLEARTLMIQVKEEAWSEPEEADPISMEEEIPESKPLLGKQFPKNYLQAKFFLNVAKDSLGERKASTSDTKRAKKLMKEAQEAFDEERYTEALSLAISCNRVLKDEAPEDGAQEPAADIRCPRCEAQISKEDAYCGKCGASLASVPWCPECDAEIGEDDNFCRKCGASLKAAEPAR